MKSSQGPSEEAVMNYLRRRHPDLAKAIADAEPQNDLGLAPPDIPDFQLLKVIGRGGFGIVWLGRNVHDCHLYAVKVFDRQAAVELAGIREFKSRATSNPFLVSISHVGQTEQFYYYVMRLADNACDSQVVEVDQYEPLTLELHVTQSGGLDLDSVQQIATRILLGLERLHESGLAHNDIKPENILRIAGTWQLGDPGLMTRAGQVDETRGTREFRPSATDTDGRTRDLYALGKTMRFMVTGSLNKPVRSSPQSQQRKCIASCIERACSSDEAQRFHSASEMRRTLEPQQVNAPATKVWRKRFVLLFGAVTVMSVLALAAAYFASVRPAKIIDGFINSSGARAFPRNNDANVPLGADVQDAQEPIEVGYQFEVVVPVTIDRLGIWDGPGTTDSPNAGEIGDGLEQSSNVTLYNWIGGVVSSASIEAGAHAETDEFAYVEIPPVKLTAGIYTLSASYTPGGNSFYNAGAGLSPKRGGTAPLVSIPHITIKANRWGSQGHIPSREIPTTKSGYIEAYVGPTAGVVSSTVRAGKTVGVIAKRPRPERVLAAFETETARKNETKQLQAVDVDDRLAVGPLEIGPGLSDTNSWVDGRMAPKFSNAQSLEQAISLGEYLGFKVKLNANDTVDVAGIEATLFSNEGRSRHFVVLSSLTGFRHDMALSRFDGPVTGLATYGQETRYADLSNVPELQGIRGSFEFRLYFYGDPDRPRHKFEDNDAVGLGNSSQRDLILFGRVK